MWVEGEEGEEVESYLGCPVSLRKGHSLVAHVLRDKAAGRRAIPSPSEASSTSPPKNRDMMGTHYEQDQASQGCVSF